MLRRSEARVCHSGNRLDPPNHLAHTCRVTPTVDHRRSSPRVPAVQEEMLGHLSERTPKRELGEQYRIGVVGRLEGTNTVESRSADHSEHDKKVMWAHQDLFEADPWSIVVEVQLPKRAH